MPIFSIFFCEIETFHMNFFFFWMRSACHFPIDDFALRDSSDLLSIVCKISSTPERGVIERPSASYLWQVHPMP